VARVPLNSSQRDSRRSQLDDADWNGGPSGEHSLCSDRRFCLVTLTEQSYHGLLVHLQPRQETINVNGLTYGGGSSLDRGLLTDRRARHDPGTTDVS
jgi:hypothetical protein